MNDNRKQLNDLLEKGQSYLLCPVLFCSWGGWFIVMKKAKLLSPEDWAYCWQFKISEHKKYFPGDDRNSNYGIINKKIVKIDYADLIPKGEINLN